MSTKKLRLSLFSSLKITSQEDFDHLKNSFDQAIKNNQKIVRFGKRRIPVKKLAQFFNRYPLFESTPNNVKSQSNSSQNTPKPTVERPQPTQPNTSTTNSQVAKFSQVNRKIIEVHNQKVQLSTAAANAASIVLRGNANQDLISFLRGSVYNYLSQNPYATPTEAVRWAINVARTQTTHPSLQSASISDQIGNNLSQQSWNRNQEVIKKTLGSSGPVFIQPSQKNSVESQISSLIKAENVNLPDGKVREISGQIKQAVDAVAASSNPANVSKKDLVQAVKQVLAENNYTVAQSQINVVHDDLIQLAYTNAHQEIVSSIKPEFAPKLGINPQTKSGNLSLNNARVIFKISEQTQKATGVEQDPGVILQNLIAKYYHNQRRPQSNTSAIFTTFRQRFFSSNNQMYQPNYYVLAQQIPQYQTYLINQPNLAPSSFQNITQLMKMFSNTASGPGGINIGNLSKLGGSLGNGLSGLKNLFGFGKGAGGLLAKTAQAGKGVSVLLGGITTASIPAWLPVAALVVLGVFILLYFNRFQLDTVAEVRSDYAMGGGITQSGAQYLTGTKTVDKKKLENNTSAALNYTYSLSPVSDPVTITGITDEISIISESGTEKIDFTDETPKPGDQVLSTSYTSPSYSYAIQSDVSDSIIVNTITINFTTIDGKQENIVSVATTIVGNPTLVGCPQIWPVDSGYAITQGPRGSYSHSAVEALDISTPMNTNVYAVQSGVVKFADWYTRWPVYGKTVIIESTLENGTEYQHWYNHLNAILVSEGEIVAPGQVIAKSGNTADGVAGGTAIHLHFEYRDGEGQTTFKYATCPLPGIDPADLYQCNGAPDCNHTVP